MKVDTEMTEDSEATRFTVRDNGATKEGRSFTVLDRGMPCGPFERNYCGFGGSTFAPFTVGERWFALYSPDYTCTRVLSLPECVDIGGEEPDSFGFCPVELWVPRYRLSSFDTECAMKKEGSDGYETAMRRISVAVFEGSAALSEAEARIAAESAFPDRRVPGTRVSASQLSDWRSCPFGFVAGCIWGDDTAWKIEFIDLSAAAQGVIKREARFGYAELISDGGLREAVDLSHWSPERPYLAVKALVHHDLSEAFVAPPESA